MVEEAAATGAPVSQPAAAPSNPRKSGGFNMPSLQTPLGPWVLDFALRHMTCHSCKMLCVDPVIEENDGLLLCRLCADGLAANNADHVHVVALPSGLRDAMKELRELAVAAHTLESEAAAQANTSRAADGVLPDNDTSVRSDFSAAAAAHDTSADLQHPPHDASGYIPAQPIPGRKYVKVKRPNAVKCASTTPVASPERAAAPNHGEPLLPAFQGLSLNPNVDTVVAKQLNVEATLNALFDAETRGREATSTQCQVAFMELQQRFTTQLQKMKGRRKGSSRNLKVEADEQYEKANYSASIDLYTRAINVNDGTARLPVLHGNRSAAYFMSLMYPECISDCMEVIADDPSSIKMFQRAFKAAVNMGDLARAVGVYDRVSAEIMTDPMREEHQKAKQGVDLLLRAKKFGTAPDAEELWKMLATEFSDTIPFRLALAQYYFNACKFEKSIDVLSRVIGPARSADVLLLSARSMYFGGFEFFDRARETLSEPPALNDEACRSLLATLNKVDEGKQNGNRLFSQREFAESILEYSKAIDADSSNSRILRILFCNRAAAFKELGKYREGIEDCTKALNLDPAFSKAFARRARCYQHLNDFVNAVKDFKSAIQFDPTDHELPRELKAAELGSQREAEREKDYYYVLGVARTATDKEIKLKYRELSLRWHPDKCVGLPEDEQQNAEHKFKVIGEAYTTLMDTQKRRDYDAKLDREKFAAQRHGSAYSYFDTAGANNGTGAYFARATSGMYAGAQARAGAPPYAQRPRPTDFW